MTGYDVTTTGTTTNSYTDDRTTTELDTNSESVVDLSSAFVSTLNSSESTNDITSSSTESDFVTSPQRNEMREISTMTTTLSNNNVPAETTEQQLYEIIRICYTIRRLIPRKTTPVPPSIGPTNWDVVNGTTLANGIDVNTVTETFTTSNTKHPHHSMYLRLSNIT